MYSVSACVLGFFLFTSEISLSLWMAFLHILLSLTPGTLLSDCKQPQFDKLHSPSHTFLLDLHAGICSFE